MSTSVFQILQFLRTWLNRRTPGFFITGLLLAVCWLIVLTPQQGTGAGELRSCRHGRITILHTNDIHDHLDPFTVPGTKEETGGVARIGTLIDKIRAEIAGKKGEGVIVLDAGDLLMGTLYFTFYRGEADFKSFELMSYDAFVLGNHEFDISQEALARVLSYTGCEILGANVVFPPESPLRKRVRPWIILERAGLRIGIVGLVTPELGSLVKAGNVKGILIKDPFETARKQIAELEGKVELVIFLTHLGLPVDLALASTVDGIDVIIGGHSHSELQEALTVRGPRGKPVIIAHAGAYGKNLGELVLDVRIEKGASGEKKKVVQPVSSRLHRIDSKIPPRSDIEKLLEGYRKGFDRRVKEIVGETLVVLQGERSHSRGEETNLGNMIADAMLEAVSADVALMNGGGIRRGIDAGKISVADILQMHPFSNMLVTFEATGAELEKAFRHVAENMEGGGFGGFLQVGGMKVDYRKKAGALSITIRGKPLERSAKYKVVTTDFIAGGGDGFNMFSRAKEAYQTGIPLETAVINYLRKHSPVKPVVEGRITVSAN